MLALPRTPGSGNSDGWYCRAAGPEAPARLFYFPFAGGNAAAVLPWQAHLGTGVELRVAQLPGRGARLFEDPLHDLDALVAELAGALAGLADRRFALFGHSLGALVAFEVARALRRAGRPAPERLWASGAEGPRTRLVERRVSHLPDAELVTALADYGGTPPELLADRDMMELLLPGVRADLTLNERYAYRTEPPLDLPIHVLRGAADPYVDAGRAAGWAQESTRPLRETVYPGDHFFVHPHEADIAALVAAALAADPVPGRAP